MNENSFTNWKSMSDGALVAQIGAFIKYHRQDQNKTQQVLAHEAGISRSTLSLIERGEAVTLDTLIRLLRVLNQLHIMDAFVVQPEISPLEMARAEHGNRKRVRLSTLSNPVKTE